MSACDLSCRVPRRRSGKTVLPLINARRMPAWRAGVFYAGGAADPADPRCRSGWRLGWSDESDEVQRRFAHDPALWLKAHRYLMAPQVLCPLSPGPDLVWRQYAARCVWARAMSWRRL